MEKKYEPLSDFLSEYQTLNSNNLHKPVAVGKFGIRFREDIFSKELAKDYSKNKLIFKNTLTIGMGSNQIDIGILTDDVIYAVSPAYHTYQINGINSKYLDYCLKYKNPEMFARYVKRGSRQGKSIDLKGWLSYKIPIVSIEEQELISSTIGKIFDLRDKSQKAIYQMDGLIKSKFINTFGDPSSLFNTANFVLADTGKIITGKTPSTAHEEYYDSADIPFVKPGDLDATSVLRIEKTEQYLSENARKACRLFPSDSVLYVCIGATIGKVGISSCECTCNQQINAIIPNKNVDSIYLAYYLHYIKNQVVSIANAPVVPIINKSNFSNIPVFIPDLAKQKEFASFANQVNQLKNKLVLLVDKINILYKSLLQKYFG